MYRWEVLITYFTNQFVTSIPSYVIVKICSYTIFLRWDKFENVNTDYSHCPYLDYTPSLTGPNDYDILVVEKEKFDQNIPRTQEKNLSCVAMFVGHMCGVWRCLSNPLPYPDGATMVIFLSTAVLCENCYQHAMSVCPPNTKLL